MKRYAVPVFAGIAAVGFVATLWMVFCYAPMEPELHFNQKIFYYHVAHGFMLFTSVAVCGVASLVFLKKRQAKWDDVALAAAEVAVAFGAVVLITGSIWGKPAWDIWWTWEKRLTMSLLLWLVLFRPNVSGWWTLGALGLTIMGFVLLVMRQPSARDEDDPDNGARI